MFSTKNTKSTKKVIEIFSVPFVPFVAIRTLREIARRGCGAREIRNGGMDEPGVEIFSRAASPRED